MASKPQQGALRDVVALLPLLPAAEAARTKGPLDLANHRDCIDVAATASAESVATPLTKRPQPQNFRGAFSPPQFAATFRG
ncbi:hypothetical protein LMG28140_03879 [Paraburkholderia metrosideri]|uniref:Uncharacterized protein n=2 Tax=Paraburkholderia metrosideri TaxID=580937 RepID=A0ABN7HXJ5_9BURK|nr:hypothetical protein LMG28140_03879 [Paraburkholderia metrosideri]